MQLNGARLSIRFGVGAIMRGHLGPGRPVRDHGLRETAAEGVAETQIVTWDPARR